MDIKVVEPKDDQFKLRNSLTAFPLLFEFFGIHLEANILKAYFFGNK